MNAQTEEEARPRYQSRWAKRKGTVEGVRILFWRDAVDKGLKPEASKEGLKGQAAGLKHGEVTRLHRVEHESRGSPRSAPSLRPKKKSKGGGGAGQYRSTGRESSEIHPTRIPA